MLRLLVYLTLVLAIGVFCIAALSGTSMMEAGINQTAIEAAGMTSAYNSTTSMFGTALTALTGFNLLLVLAMLLIVVMVIAKAASNRGD